LIKSAVQEELYEFLLGRLTRQLPDDHRRRYSPETLATFLSWSLFGAAVEWNRNRTKASQEVANQVVELLIEEMDRLA